MNGGAAATPLGQAAPRLGQSERGVGQVRAGRRRPYSARSGIASVEPVDESHQVGGDRLLQHVLVDARKRVAKDEIDLGLAEAQGVQPHAATVESIVERHPAAPQYD